MFSYIQFAKVGKILDICKRQGRNGTRSVLRTHGADGLTAAAVVVVVHALAARTEVEAPRAERVVRAERRGPVVAVLARVVELTVPAAAGGGQEEAVAVGGGELAACDAVQGSPLGGGVGDEFFPVLLGRHAGAVAQLLRGSVVNRLQGGQVVGCAPSGAGVVLGEGLQAALGVNGAVLVRAPVVDLLRGGLAPGVVVAMALGRGGGWAGPGPPTRQ